MSMQLKLHDTLSREKRPFEPLDPARVRMYVCGPTVYDFAHIGNGRPAIVFDVLFRLLRHLYGERAVTYVRNITDVDDKINARAAERGVPIRTVTEETLKNYQEDVAALGCLPPTVEPRATEHIDEMKALIERLIGENHAYVAEEHVLFSVPSMPDYGSLSKRPLDEMIAGARVDVAPYKRDAMDFVLWKPSKPGEPAWPSPGRIATPGRPGWHIECSAMAWKHLGETFDIHGGGIDLVFPHHENEIAQSRCAFHSPVMARYWMHNGFLQVEGEKMSKSLSNFATMRELLSLHPGDVLRLLMLMTHYKQPLDWTQVGLESARNELLRWSEFLLDFFDPTDDLDGLSDPDAKLLEALCDDLNTPLAITRLREMFTLAQKGEMPAQDFAASARWMGFHHLNHSGFFHPGFEARLFESGPQIEKNQEIKILGLRAAAANGFSRIADELARDLSASGLIVKIDEIGALQVGNKTSAEMTLSEQTETAATTVTVVSPFGVGLQMSARLLVVDHSKVQRLVEERNLTRRAKNFAEADRIRDELAAMGVELEDHKDGTTTWKVKR
jgi:cysteinyl-tRNA synthetase